MTQAHSTIGRAEVANCGWLVEPLTFYVQRNGVHGITIGLTVLTANTHGDKYWHYYCY